MTDANQIKREICEIGARLYQRGLVAGTDGNISVRLTDNQVLCTPSMQSKGFLKPDDICLVDMEGNQLAGAKQRTSEILLPLEVLNCRSDVQSVVHCHAPHASAFAVTGQPIPLGVTPESVCFLGEIPLAPYETPGTVAFAQTIRPFVHRTNVCLLANHGTVTYADSLLQAYHLTEMLDSYCRILLLTEQLGPLQFLAEEECHKLTEMRIAAGWAPPTVDTPS